MSNQPSRKMQVFSYKDDAGVERKLHVEAMRAWAEKNLELVAVNVDINKVEDMLKNGRVDQDYILNHTMRSMPKPILVCADFAEGRSEIVDGNHTYVAMAAVFARAPAMGFAVPERAGIPAYVFERDQWTRFLI